MVNIKTNLEWNIRKDRITGYFESGSKKYRVKFTKEPGNILLFRFPISRNVKEGNTELKIKDCIQDALKYILTNIKYPRIVFVTSDNQDDRIQEYLKDAEKLAKEYSYSYSTDRALIKSFGYKKDAIYILEKQ